MSQLFIQFYLFTKDIMNSWLKLTGNVEVNEKLENSVSILFLIQSIK